MTSTKSVWSRGDVFGEFDITFDMDLEWLSLAVCIVLAMRRW